MKIIDALRRDAPEGLALKLLAEMVETATYAPAEWAALGELFQFYGKQAEAET